MKTITLDFETYEKELSQAYEKGKANGTDLVKRADELLRDVTNHKWRENFQYEIYSWLRDYSESLK
jgi:hypothetical protein